MRDLRIWILCAIALAGIALGTWGAFPFFDDASLLLLWIEKGPGTIYAGNLHRPIVGLLLQFFVDAAGITKLPYLFINLVFWSVFSWQIFLLSRRLFPEGATASLSALLILTPIIAKTHYTTINTLFPVNLPVSICIGLLLLCLKENIGVVISLVVAFLTALASAMSEYAVAASAASVILLITLKRNRPAISLFTGALLGYVIFQSTANFKYRPTRAVGTQIEMLATRPLSAITHLGHALWNVFIGAYGTAAGKVVIDADSISTLLAAAIGIVAAVLILQSFRKNLDEISNKNRETIALIFAVVAGLLPVTIANQSPAGGDSYETRFLIPILPFATIVSVRTILYLTKLQLRPIVAAVLTFIAIFTVFNGAFEVRREQKFMDSFSKILGPIVEEASAMTIVVVPNFEKLDGSDITPKIVLHWPRELLPKVWVLTAREIIPLKGPRNHCNSVDFNLPPAVLSSGRKGKISNLFFVPEFWHSQGRFTMDSFEPYCVGEISNRP